MADPKLDIFIKTKADLEGLSKASEATAGLTGKSKDLQGALKGLAFEFPLLAKGLRLATNPIALLVAGLATAASAVKGYFDRLNQAEASQGLLESVNDQIGGLARYRTALKDTQDELGNLDEALKRQAGFYDELATKQLNLEKLKVQGRVNAGEITEAQGAALTGALEGRSQKESNARARGVIRAQIDNQERELWNIPSTSPEALAKARREQERQERLVPATKDETEELEKLNTDLKNIKTWREAYVNSGTTPDSYAFGKMFGHGFIKDLMGSFGRVEREKEAQKDAIVSTQDIRFVNARRAKEGADLLQSNLEKHAKGRQNLGLLRDEFNERVSVDATGEAIHDSARRQESSNTSAKELKRNIDRATGEVEQARSKLTAAFLNYHGTNKNLLDGLVKNLNEKTQELADLKKNVRKNGD